MKNIIDPLCNNTDKSNWTTQQLKNTFKVNAGRIL